MAVDFTQQEVKMIWVIGIIGYVLAVATIIAFFYGAGLKDNESRK
jgi:hypothetical protein